MEPVKLSIVIVSYNVRYHLEQCLHSVQRALLGINAEVWVVDNAVRTEVWSICSLAFPG